MLSRFKNLTTLKIAFSLVAGFVLFFFGTIPSSANHTLPPPNTGPMITSPVAGGTISGPSYPITAIDSDANSVYFGLYRNTTDTTPCRPIGQGVQSGTTFSTSFNSQTVADGTYIFKATGSYLPGPSFATKTQTSIVSNGLDGECQNILPTTVNISANGQQDEVYVTSGTSVTVSWQSQSVAGCQIKDNDVLFDWSEDGSKFFSSVTSDHTFKIECGGVYQGEDIVNVKISQSSSGGSGGSSGSSSSGSSSNQNSASNNSTSTSGQTVITEITPEILESDDNIVVEQDFPVSIGEFDPEIFLKGANITISDIKNIKKDSQTLLRFEGKTRPNTLVTLYIFSNPVIVTVKSDQNGSWSYDREKSIEAGKHQAFATIYDEGVTRRSSVKAFYLAKGENGGQSLVLSNSNLNRYLPFVYLISGAIGFAILILLMYRVYRKRKVAA